MKIAALVGVVALLVLGAVGGAAGQGRAPVPGTSALDVPPPAVASTAAQAILDRARPR